MGLKESKKWELGSIHENGGGKFEILKRWYDTDTDTIMLEYKFLDDGRIEQNKESNVNASEWKWKKVRGLVGKQHEEHEGEACLTQTGLEEYFEGIYIRLERARTERREDNALMLVEMKEQSKLIAEMMNMIRLQQKEIDNMISQSKIVDKLLEKIK